MPVCANGYNHLMDTRFEVRDAQEIFEALADRAATGATSGEGLIHPQKIGVTGGSYGGGISMALGALNDRKMVNESDPEGVLVPWVSDGGKAMKIAAAQPDIPWTDLAYSLQPNGHTLDYVADAPYLAARADRRREDVVHRRSSTGLAQALSNYAPPGHRPRCRPHDAGSRRSAPASPTTRTRCQRTSSTSSRRTTRPTTSTTRRSRRRC